jgi:hypothetical protein
MPSRRCGPRRTERRDEHRASPQSIDKRTGDWHHDQARDGRTGQERSNHGEGDPPDLMQVDEQERQHQPGSDHGHGVAGEEQACRTGQPRDVHGIRSWCNWVPIKRAN